MQLRDIADRASATDMVRRSYEIEDFEFRTSEDGEGFTFEGVASVVDTPYTVRDVFGEFQETIKAGAFTKTLKDSKADVALFVNHNTQSVPLATRGAGTLKLVADPNLRVCARLDPSRPSVLDIKSAVSRGEMRQMSIGFSVPKARDKWNADYTERWISEVNLGETSIVWRGANPHTTGAMRSVDELLEAIDAGELTEDEIRRAIDYFERLLPASEDDGPEGLVVTPELIQFWDLRK